MLLINLPCSEEYCGMLQGWQKELLRNGKVFLDMENKKAFQMYEFGLSIFWRNKKKEINNKKNNLRY